jgi:hypothetical protein
MTHKIVIFLRAAVPGMDDLKVSEWSAGLPSRRGVDKLQSMVRPFDLRDLALIRRLGERGVSLHTASALAENFHPLRGAIVSMLVGGEYPTFVWKPDNGDRAGFIQLRIPNGANQAFVLYISPRCGENEGGGLPSGNGLGDSILRSPDCSVWLALLDEAVAGVGSRGVHHIIAEVDEHSSALQVLRRSGFAVYTRQDIWAVRAADYQPLGMTTHRLTRRSQADEWDIQLLYANTVPRLVQIVEPLPSNGDGEGWVLRDGSELAAFVNIRKGAVATWLRFFIHPEAEAEAEEIVAAALEVTFAQEPELVYCCVRRYESWLPSALERGGCTLFGSQAVMVRHIVHHSPRVVPETSVALEGQRISASSPIIRNFRKADKNNKNGSS